MRFSVRTLFIVVFVAGMTLAAGLYLFKPRVLGKASTLDGKLNATLYAQALYALDMPPVELYIDVKNQDGALQFRLRRGYDESIAEARSLYKGIKFSDEFVPAPPGVTVYGQPPYTTRRKDGILVIENLQQDVGE